MRSAPVISTPEDDSARENEKKRKRQISNRESAKRSRMRKRELLSGLESTAAHFRSENTVLAAKAAALAQDYMIIEMENSMLRAQVAELVGQLSSLNSILGALLGFTAAPVEMEEIPEHILMQIHGIPDQLHDAPASMQSVMVQQMIDPYSQPWQIQYSDPIPTAGLDMYQ